MMFHSRLHPNSSFLADMSPTHTRQYPLLCCMHESSNPFFLTQVSRTLVPSQTQPEHLLEATSRLIQLPVAAFSALPCFPQTAWHWRGHSKAYCSASWVKRKIGNTQDGEVYTLRLWFLFCCTEPTKMQYTHTESTLSSLTERLLDFGIAVLLRSSSSSPIVRYFHWCIAWGVHEFMPLSAKTHPSTCLITSNTWYCNGFCLRFC